MPSKAIYKEESNQINVSRRVLIPVLEKYKEGNQLDIRVISDGYCNASSILYGYLKLQGRESYQFNLLKTLCTWDEKQNIDSTFNDFFQYLPIFASPHLLNICYFTDKSFWRHWLH